MFNAIEQAIAKKILRDQFNLAISQIKNGQGAQVMSKWWPTFSIIIGSAVTAFTPTVQALLGKHGTATAIIAGVLGIIAHWLPSPAQTPAA